MATETTARRPVRWHIAVFLAPAVLVYTAIMILPLIGTLQQSFFHVENGKTVFVVFGNFTTLFGDPRL
jgi:raffinose/stachyose/melibiose transport system permease protein